MNAYGTDQVSTSQWSAPNGHRVYHRQRRPAINPDQSSGHSTLLQKLESQMDDFVAAEQRTYSEIRRVFVLRDEDVVLRFLSDHRSLMQLLLESEVPLRKYFGSTPVIILKAPIDEDGSRTLYAVVLWSGTVKDVRSALSAFDENWWLARASQAAGRLSFTYELI